MSSTDRNFWDLPTPPGHIEFAAWGLAVDVCIYILVRSERAFHEKDVIAHVQEAARIWSQAKVNIQAVYIETSATLRPSEPIDISVENLAAQTACPFSDAFAEQLLKLVSRGQNLAESVAVFYIPGSFLRDGRSTGCHRYYFPQVKTTDDKPLHIIILTDKADGRTLAHELGHAIFTRETPTKGVWTNDDSDLNRDPNQPIHNADKSNLMFPYGLGSSVSSKQAELAQSPENFSPLARRTLVQARRLVFGFVEDKQPRLGVLFRSLKVNYSSDEISSDDELESLWSFSVKIAQVDGTTVLFPIRSWSRDPLEVRDHPFTGNNAEAYIDFADIRPMSASDKLIIEVAGRDQDYGPDDDLPSLKNEWSKDPDTWGLGDHTMHAEDSEINYDVTYNIRVDEWPIKVTFRVVF